MHSSLAARTKIADARTWKDPLSNIDEISNEIPQRGIKFDCWSLTREFDTR